MIKYIFVDFNGTILDDVDLCLELLNKILMNQNKKTITKEEYKNIFKFPIKQYYLDAGITFDNESYESLAVKFIDKYKILSKKCNLFSNTIDTFKYLRNKNIHLILLSASEKNNLLEQCKYYGIVDYFDEILGINNIYAESKSGLGLDYINKNKIDKEECIFIGDTDHDFLVSREMGVKCILVTSGHQSPNVLNKCNTKILNNFNEIRCLVDDIN